MFLAATPGLPIAFHNHKKRDRIIAPLGRRIRCIPASVLRGAQSSDPDSTTWMRIAEINLGIGKEAYDLRPLPAISVELRGLEPPSA